MSNALLEAMACALPSVATSVGGNCQLVQQGRTGFLVPTEDSDAAAARLLELLDHPALARTMGQEARLLIEEHYSIDAVIQQLTRQYDTLLGRP
jgi:glycosyltransferase involved in cell wall biosynthesis